MVLAVLGPAAPAGATPADETIRANAVVVVGVAGLEWTDVTADRTPTLAKLASRGSVGTLSVRAAPAVTCAGEGWLTLGAGRSSAIIDPSDIDTGAGCGPRTAPPVTVTKNGASVAGWDELAAINRNLRFGARPGLLGTRLNCTGAVGTGGALAAADSSGNVDVYRPTLPDDPGPLLRACPFTAVDLGILPDSGSYGDRRATALRQLDTALAQIDATRPTNSTLLVVGVADTDATDGRLHVAIADGPGFDGGWLRSPSTGRTPYLQLVDVAPTVLAALNLPVPDDIAGRPVFQSSEHRPQGFDATRTALVDAGTAAVARKHLVGSFLAGFVVLFAVVIGLAAAVLRRRPTPAVEDWPGAAEDAAAERPDAGAGRRPGSPDRSPTDRSPTDRSPADRSPADRSPADRSPADRSPAAEDRFSIDADRFAAAADRLPPDGERWPGAVDSVPADAARPSPAEDRFPAAADRFPAAEDRLSAGGDRLPSAMDRRLDGADRAPAAADVRLHGADGAPAAADGRLDGADGAPAAADGRLDGADGAPAAVDRFAAVVDRSSADEDGRSDGVDRASPDGGRLPAAADRFPSAVDRFSAEEDGRSDGGDSASAGEGRLSAGADRFPAGEGRRSAGVGRFSAAADRRPVVEVRLPDVEDGLSAAAAERPGAATADRALTAADRLPADTDGLPADADRLADAEDGLPAERPSAAEDRLPADRLPADADRLSAAGRSAASGNRLPADRPPAAEDRLPADRSPADVDRLSAADRLAAAGGRLTAADRPSNAADRLPADRLAAAGDRLPAADRPPAVADGSPAIDRLSAVDRLATAAGRGGGSGAPGAYPAERFGGVWPGRLSVAVTALGAFPVATFLANLVPWWRADPPAPALAGAILGAMAIVTGIAITPPWGRSASGRMATVSAITVVVLLADVMSGARLQLNSLLGYTALEAGRFVGFGNVAFAVLGASALLLAAALATGRKSRSAVAVALAVAVPVIVVEGSPGWGTDVGGILTLVPAFGVLALLVAGRKITTGKAAAVLGAGAALVATLAIADYLRPEEDRTHFGRFVATVLDGEGLATVDRKVRANLDLLFAGPHTITAAVLLVIAAVGVFRPPAGLRAAYVAHPGLRTGLRVVVVLGLVGFAVNDSGIAIPLNAALVALPAAVAAWLRPAPSARFGGTVHDLDGHTDTNEAGVGVEKETDRETQDSNRVTTAGETDGGKPADTPARSAEATADVLP
ncbi:hypothetical protein [Cryptosporangium phraense]|uniref:Uncharacterized protein n=1 Tax=Cryptosporangium phraense TaxID=2593070 RepID=A0A545AEY9_9ACTN|nr:hypothetical protein [Cryptosporangium phraense]TQS39884.1 hypothetical protein FL583_37715 [Cryptosporangium phraense]